MRIAYKMEYVRPVNEKSSVRLVQYSPEYQDEYKRIYNECFHEMRAALGKEPVDFIQDDSFFQEGMDRVFLLLKNGEIIGSVALKDCEIDNLFVNQKYQGQGYGKQILLWALENINTDNIILHASDWNQRAVRLYKNTGFEITEVIKID